MHFNRRVIENFQLTISVDFRKCSVGDALEHQSAGVEKSVQAATAFVAHA